VKGAHLLIDGARARRYTGLIPKISPLAIITIALAQLKIDRPAKQVPVDAPWTAKRAEEWDVHSIAWWIERSGIRSAIGRELFEMAVQALFPATWVRSIAQHDDHVVIETAELTVSARHAVVTIPPALDGAVRSGESAGGEILELA
jgi:hypothetical protein